MSDKTGLAVNLEITFASLTSIVIYDEAINPADPFAAGEPAGDDAHLSYGRCLAFTTRSHR